MAANRWLRRTDGLMRSTHLYTGLFLVPWMLVYAISAMALNHGSWVRTTFEIEPPKWTVERQIDFVPGDDFPLVREQQAQAILKHLDLVGAHRLMGKPNPKQLVIVRFSGSGNYRVTWQRRNSKLVVEKQQPFSALRLIHFLHFRAGYGQRYAVNLIWAVLVDLVSVSIGAWVVSGVYLWLRTPRRRMIGGVFAVAGMILFIVLVGALCA